MCSGTRSRRRHCAGSEEGRAKGRSGVVSYTAGGPAGGGGNGGSGSGGGLGVVRIDSEGCSNYYGVWGNDVLFRRYGMMVAEGCGKGGSGEEEHSFDGEGDRLNEVEEQHKRNGTCEL